MLCAQGAVAVPGELEELPRKGEGVGGVHMGKSLEDRLSVVPLFLLLQGQKDLQVLLFRQKYTLWEVAFQGGQCFSAALAEVLTQSIYQDRLPSFGRGPGWGLGPPPCGKPGR